MVKIYPDAIAGEIVHEIEFWAGKRFDLGRRYLVLEVLMEEGLYVLCSLETFDVSRGYARFFLLDPTEDEGVPL